MIDEFRERDPIFASRYPDLITDKETMKKQSCLNWRCRGNVDDYCIYKPKNYKSCLDKDAVDSDFFKYD